MDTEHVGSTGELGQHATDDNAKINTLGIKVDACYANDLADSYRCVAVLGSWIRAVAAIGSGSFLLSMPKYLSQRY